MAAERGVDRLDARDGASDPPGDRRASSLRVVAGLAGTAAEAVGRLQGISDRIELLLGALGADGVVRRLGEVALLAQLVDAELVCGARLLVEDLAGMTLRRGAVARG